MSFEAIATADTLESALEPVSALVDEMRIHLNEDGVHILAVDPANVGMVDARLDASAFESFEADGGTIGVNLDRLEEVVGFANAGELVYLELNEDTRKLDIKFGGLSYTLALIDLDSIRQDPDIPDLDLPATVTMEQGDLKTGAKAADMVSDHIRFRADVDEQALFIEAEGDTDNVELELDNEDLIAAQVPEDAQSLYSLDYVKDMVRAMPSAEVTVRLGTEFPVKLSYETAEGAGAVEYMLAPRIQSE